MAARRESIAVEIVRHDHPTPAISRTGIATGLARAIMAWGPSGVTSNTADRESSTNVPMDVVPRTFEKKAKKRHEIHQQGTRRVPSLTCVHLLH